MFSPPGKTSKRSRGDQNAKPNPPVDNNPIAPPPQPLHLQNINQRNLNNYNNTRNSSNPSNPPSSSPPDQLPPQKSNDLFMSIDDENLQALIDALLPSSKSTAAQISLALASFEERITPCASYLFTTSSSAALLSPESTSYLPVPTTTSSVSEAKKRLESWRCTLEVGDKIETMDNESACSVLKFKMKYFASKVIGISKGGVNVRFDGFGRKHDRLFSFDLENILPAGGGGGYAKLCINRVKREKKRKNDEILEKKAAEFKVKEKAEDEENATIPETVTSRSGRKVKPPKNLSDIDPKPNSNSNTTKRKRSDTAGTAKSEPNAETVTKSSAKIAVVEDDYTWICMECLEAEAPDDVNATLIICDGPCQRPFHMPCVDLTVLPKGDWVCVDCRRKSHNCSICMEEGKDNEEGGVIKCIRKNCGLFFHESCLSFLNAHVDQDALAEQERTSQQQLHNNDTSSSSDPDPDSEVTKKPYNVKFTCPAHMCWTCGDVKVNKKRSGRSDTKSGPLVRCLYCPISYHMDCIAPLAKFHELALCCHEHKDMKLPDLSPEESILASETEMGARGVVKDVDDIDVDVDVDDVLVMKPKMISRDGVEDEVESFAYYGGYSLPSHNIDDDSYSNQSEDSSFLLPFEMHTEVFSKPPPYSHTHTLKYPITGPKPSRQEQGDVCKCVPLADGSGCGEDCLNRIMKIECVGDASSKGSANCNCGVNCGNRRLNKRELARTRPKREVGKGWGLAALDGAAVGDLIQEYVGEVLSQEQITHRLDEHERLKPNDPNFYVMELENGWYIDAREKGNLSRFINHSCDPNCQLERVNVNGFIRIGIFCIRDIEIGEMLNYDYQFDTEHADKFMCMCGTDKCRGTMKGGVKRVEALVKKTPKQLLRDARAKMEKDKLYIEKVKRDAIRRLNTTDVTVPAATSGHEFVASGPQINHREFIFDNGIALWRNVKKGGDIANRIKYTGRTS